MAGSSITKIFNKLTYVSSPQTKLRQICLLQRITNLWWKIKQYIQVFGNRKKAMAKSRCVYLTKT